MTPLLTILFLAAPLELPPPPHASDREPHTSVTVEQLASRPQQWHGRRVRVSGMVVREFENLGLYRDYDDYCGPGSERGRRVAVYADWPEDLAPMRHFRRRAVVEGTFMNRQGQVSHEDGKEVVWVSNAAPGPGPLTDVRLVRWTSAMLPECGR